MSLGQTAQSTVIDENKWVASFVSKGGEEREGREIYQRMKQSRENSQSAPIPKQITQPKSSSLVVVPEVTSAATPLQKNHAEQDTKHFHNTDLFENTPTSPEPQKKKPVVVKEDVSKKKRGRPPIKWSERTKSQMELECFQLSLEIEEKPANENNQLGVIATAMIYASLPHSEIQGSVFKRKNGDLSITILNDPDIGLPYGKMPRLLTAFLSTEAKRTKEPVIYLGKSKNEFAKKLGLGTSGGPRGALTMLTEQSKRLFTSHITLTGTPNSQFHWRNVNITEDGMILWDPHNPEAKSSWESKLTLTEKFFDECINHSVPIDMRVLHKLRSPLAIDIYIWLTYRYNSITQPTHISWKQLKWQLGANYADNDKGLSNFALEFKKHLRSISAIYKDAKFKFDQNKLTLYPSRPHVLPKPD